MLTALLHKQMSFYYILDVSANRTQQNGFFLYRYIVDICIYNVYVDLPQFFSRSAVAVFR
jgi:hypothetical protein